MTIHNRLSTGYKERNHNTSICTTNNSTRQCLFYRPWEQVKFPLLNKIPDVLFEWNTTLGNRPLCNANRTAKNFSWQLRGNRTRAPQHDANKCLMTWAARPRIQTIIKISFSITHLHNNNDCELIGNFYSNSSLHGDQMFALEVHSEISSQGFSRIMKSYPKSHSTDKILEPKGNSQSKTHPEDLP